jgi:hypothetical protein
LLMAPFHVNIIANFVAITSSTFGRIGQRTATIDVLKNRHYVFQPMCQHSNTSQTFITHNIE